MHLDEGLWKSESCFERKPYVCALSFTGSGNVTSKPTLQPAKTTELPKLTTVIDITAPVLLISSSQGPSSTVSVTEKVITQGSSTELTTELPITTEKVTAQESSTPELTTEHPITTEKATTKEPSTEQRKIYEN